MTDIEATPSVRMDEPEVIIDLVEEPPSLDQLIGEFSGQNARYYQKTLTHTLSYAGYRPSFNRAVAAFGSLWYAARGLWSGFFVFLLAESLAIVQLARGLFGELGREQRERAEAIQVTLNTRYDQIEAAQANGDDASSLEGAARSLERAVADALADADAAASGGRTLLIVGVALLIGFRLIAALTANQSFENRFGQWRSDRTVPSGLSMVRGALGLAGLAAVAGLSAARFARPADFPNLNTFPTDAGWQDGIASRIEDGFDWLTSSGGGFFNALTRAINNLLDAVETIFVGTPWPVVILVVAMLGWLTGGPRVAIFVTAALAYLGVMDFWEKAMTTLSLLGAAAMISITLGIPLGVLCARRPRLYRFVRPVLDFMQSMPSFVYLIPVIAFFGAGKPAAIAATLIFGSPPVIRFTVLGLQQVPQSAREAAMAFGATDRYMLWKVDLPLAARTIRAGINQTILLSLAMVVVASLIGAKGLGEDVLEALQFASQGKGMLAGLAILFCALILDRIVVGDGDRSRPGV